jgi:hypothetical protein
VRGLLQWDDCVLSVSASSPWQCVVGEKASPVVDRGHLVMWLAKQNRLGSTCTAGSPLLLQSVDC